MATNNLLGRREAAQFLTERGFKTAPSTLAKLACVGGGPNFISFGRRPLYAPDTLIDWAESRCTGLRRNTSDAGDERPAVSPVPARSRRHGQDRQSAPEAGAFREATGRAPHPR